MTMKQLTKKRLLLIFAGVLIGLLLVSLDSTIVATAMPKIISSLNGMNYYAWPFTAFMLCMTIAIPIFGKLSDVYGFKIIYMIGIIIFLIGSGLCGISQTMIQLIIFRGIQGIGGGVLVANTMGLIGYLFPPAERAKYLGIASSVGAIASVFGPSLGGYITDNFNWHWIFFVNLPVGIVAMLVILITLPSFKDSEECKENKRVDYFGALTLVAALVPMLLALTWGGKDYEWGSVQIIGMLIFSVIMLLIFIFIESKAADPIVPLAFFKSSVFNVSAIVMFLSNGAMVGAAIFVPLFAQTVTGQSATKSGMVTTPLMLGVVAGAVISGGVVSKTHKYKILSIFGLIVIGVGNLLLSGMGMNTNSSTIAFYVAVTGFGVGIVMPIFSVTVQNVFSKSQMGAVSSGIQFFAKMGATIASSVFGTIMLRSMNNGFHDVDMSKLPANITGALKGPNALSNAGALKKLFAHIPQKLLPELMKFMGQVKQIEADAIHNIFIICIVTAALALAAVLLLKELPITEASNKGASDSI